MACLSGAGIEAAREHIRDCLERQPEDWSDEEKQMFDALNTLEMNVEKKLKALFAEDV